MWISFAVVVIFGGIDLYLENGLFMKLESGLMNLILASLFGISFFREKTVVEELAEQQGRIAVEKNPDKTFFFRLITSIWFFYYILRAIFFTWLNFSAFDGESFIVRTLLGTASFYILLGASIGLSRPLWKLLLKLRIMPSARAF